MKGYTTIEQSKKLLSLRTDPSTADMWYSYYGNSKYNPTIAYRGQQWFLCQIRNSLHDDIPCWSLAALLSVIPQEIFDDEYIINITEGCVNKWVLTYDHYENRNYSYYELSSGADYLIDACVAMIEKLHELNIL